MGQQELDDIQETGMDRDLKWGFIHIRQFIDISTRLYEKSDRPKVVPATSIVQSRTTLRIAAVNANLRLLSP